MEKEENRYKKAEQLLRYLKEQKPKNLTKDRPINRGRISSEYNYYSTLLSFTSLKFTKNYNCRISTENLDLLCNLNKEEYSSLIFYIVYVGNNSDWPKCIEDRFISKNKFYCYVEDLKRHLIEDLKLNYTEISKVNKLCEDINVGLDGLINREIILLKDEDNISCNLDVFSMGIYDSYSPYHCKYKSIKNHIKVYLFPLKDTLFRVNDNGELERLSKTDFRLMFTLLKDIRYFDDCENLVSMKPSRRIELANELELGLDSIKKSISNLKKYNIIQPIKGKYNKYIFNRDFVFKGKEGTLDLFEDFSNYNINKIEEDILKAELKRRLNRVEKDLEVIDTITSLIDLNNRDSVDTSVCIEIEDELD